MSIDKGPEYWDAFFPRREIYDNFDEALADAGKGVNDAIKWLVANYMQTEKFSDAHHWRLKLAERFMRVCESRGEMGDMAVQSLHLSTGGDKNAPYELAEDYLLGRGVSPSINKAVEWYKKCALFDDRAKIRLAQLCLGNFSHTYTLKKPEKAQEIGYIFLKAVIKNNCGYVGAAQKVLRETSFSFTLSLHSIFNRLPDVAECLNDI